MATDPLLIALAEARRRRDQADTEIRMLLAYARELTTPRPYRLIDLAQAAGMSISGVRMAYDRSDVERAARMPVTPGSESFRQYWTAVHATCGDHRSAQDG
jgi:hypothetical protein